MEIDFERLTSTLVPRPREPQARAGGSEPRRAASRSASATGRAAIAALVAGTILSGCGRESARSPASASARLPLQVLADTGTTVTLAVPPAASTRAWLERVSVTPPARVSPPELSNLPPPDAAPEASPEDIVPRESLVVDDDLHPPIPIAPATIRPPAPSARPRIVELDVRIDEAGKVSDASWAGGSADTAAVRAATDCALAMRFHPAIRRGRPVAVWCRQRFEFDRAGARPAAATDGPP